MYNQLFKSVACLTIIGVFRRRVSRFDSVSPQLNPFLLYIISLKVHKNKHRDKPLNPITSWNFYGCICYRALRRLPIYCRRLRDGQSWSARRAASSKQAARTRRSLRGYLILHTCFKSFSAMNLCFKAVLSNLFDPAGRTRHNHEAAGRISKLKNNH